MFDEGVVGLGEVTDFVRELITLGVVDLIEVSLDNETTLGSEDDVSNLGTLGHGACGSESADSHGTINNKLSLSDSKVDHGSSHSTSNYSDWNPLEQASVDLEVSGRVDIDAVVGIVEVPGKLPCSPGILANDHSVGDVSSLHAQMHDSVVKNGEGVNLDGSGSLNCCFFSLSTFVSLFRCSIRLGS